MTRIENYALIGDTRTAALVSHEGSIDWLCLPDFNSPACFASLVGSSENGYWSIRPVDTIVKNPRRYREDTLIMENEFHTSQGVVELIDFMPFPGEQRDIIRIVRGKSGKVKMKMELFPRFEYGSMTPMIKTLDENKIIFTRGPDLLTVRSTIPLSEIDHGIGTEFEVKPGDEFFIHLTWSSSHGKKPEDLEPIEALKKTEDFWVSWLEKCHLDDNSCHPEIIKRSILTLKALTCGNFGSIVAAPTCSLPEAIGGKRNWDYRFCWPRDAALAMRAVLNSTGQKEEIEAWRDWLVRATAGIPSQLSVLYTLDGSKAMSETLIPWLNGYEESRPVRVGNLAQEQLQLDIFGAVIEVFYLAESMGLPPVDDAWELVRGMLDYLETLWQKPDEGIWEVRGPRRHFVHSKLMVWAAYKWGIKAAQDFGVKGDVERWIRIQDDIFLDICERGFNAELGCFTQYYGSRDVDASLLRMPLLEFLPVNDPRIEGTIKKIETDLVLGDGLVMRYLPDPEVEGLPDNGPRAFFLCSAWLGEVYALQGRMKEAEDIHHKIISLTNDVGLLSEQYDPKAQRLLGNFPQAFSHIALLRLELSLSRMRTTNK